jgi:hypothetical protein
MLAALLLAALQTASPAPPRPALSVYVTRNYGLTFSVPKGITYCPLPRGWVGSDHGTTLFLRPPARCDTAADATNTRSAAAEDAPRIEVFYGNELGEDELADADCPPLGHLRLLGGPRPICSDVSVGKGMQALSVRAHAGASTIVLTLQTTADRYSQDVETLRVLAASVRRCSASWVISGKRSTTGTGAPCPVGRWF